MAVITTAPRIDGFQLQVATILGDEPVVNLFLHPAIMMFLALKVTFDATETFAVIVTTCLKVALPPKVSELKADVGLASNADLSCGRRLRKRTVVCTPKEGLILRAKAKADAELTLC